MPTMRIPHGITPTGSIRTCEKSASTMLDRRGNIPDRGHCYAPMHIFNPPPGRSNGNLLFVCRECQAETHVGEDFGVGNHTAACIIRLLEESGLGVGSAAWKAQGSRSWVRT